MYTEVMEKKLLPVQKTAPGGTNGATFTAVDGSK